MNGNARALRRHHIARLKHKRRRDYHIYDRDSGRLTGPLNRHVTTPCLCSCRMCGNPRKFHGNSRAARTVAERRAAERFDFETACMRNDESFIQAA
ncbi:hypothetical protein [Neisseria sp. CCUG12390]|uniref:hypothetical protein n=1 Tax=Neisseria sp. CCUG12390 TaxID=3392035 RepID=UPI003A0FE3D0